MLESLIQTLKAVLIQLVLLLCAQELPIATFENETYEVCPNATIPIDLNVIPTYDDNPDSFEVSWTYNGDILENENSLTLGVL